MRTRTNMNDDWLFHYGELKVRPHEIARKAYSLGGLTASLPEEKQKELLEQKAVFAKMAEIELK